MLNVYIYSIVLILLFFIFLLYFGGREVGHRQTEREREIVSDSRLVSYTIKLSVGYF